MLTALVAIAALAADPSPEQLPLLKTFRGEFIELETTAPKTCIRLPMYAIEDARSYLPLS